MNCVSELTLGMFVDGEVNTMEAESIRSHLAGCVRCRTLAAVLREENRALAGAVWELVTEPEQWPAAAPQRHAARYALAAIALVAAALAIPLNGLSEQLPSAVSWLNPFSLAGHWNITTAAAAYLASNLAGLVATVVNFIGGLLLVLTAVVAALLYPRLAANRRPVLACFALLAFVLPASAVTFRTGQHIVTIPKSEVIDQVLFAAGEHVLVDGTVNGDVIAFAQVVEIRGTVKGDLIAMAQTTEVRGVVEGNVFTVAQTAAVPGQIRGNLYVSAGMVRLETGGVIGGELFSGSGFVNLNGTLQRGASIYGQVATVAGGVGRDVTFHGMKLILTDEARIGGKVTATVPDASLVSRASAAVVGGGVTTKISKRESQWRKPRHYFWLAVELLGALLAALVFLWVAPALLQRSVTALGSYGRSLGIGFVALIVTPIGVLIAAATLVGLPLAFIAAGIWLCAMYVAKIVVAGLIGQSLLRSNLEKKRDWLLAMLIGLAILTAVFQLPFGIGTAFHIAVMCFGMGALFRELHASRRPV